MVVVGSRIKFKGPNRQELVGTVLQVTSHGVMVRLNGINEHVPTAHIISVIDNGGNQQYTPQAVADSGVAALLGLLAAVVTGGFFLYMVFLSFT